MLFSFFLVTRVCYKKNAIHSSNSFGASDMTLNLLYRSSIPPFDSNAPQQLLAIEVTDGV